MDYPESLGAIASLALIGGSAFLAQAACFKAAELIARRRRPPPDPGAAAPHPARP